MWQNPPFPANLAPFTEEIFNKSLTLLKYLQRTEYANGDLHWQKYFGMKWKGKVIKDKFKISFIVNFVTSSLPKKKKIKGNRKLFSSFQQGHNHANDRFLP